MTWTTPPSDAHDIPRSRDRRGFALVLTLGAIVVIGLLIAGIFFITNQQLRGGNASVRQEEAFRQAESALALRLTDWSNDTLPEVNGQSVLATIDETPVTITRLSDTVYRVASRAAIGDGGTRHEAARQVDQLVRLLGPDLKIRGALTVRGGVTIHGTPEIDGKDHQPAGWSCGAPAPAKPGIAGPDLSKMSSTGNCKDFKCVEGNPPVIADPVAGDPATYNTFGDFTWAELVSLADIRMTADVQPEPVVSGGKCVKSMSNWGDPSRSNPAKACESYYPVIYYPGDAKLTGGTGQGILLVEGTLEVKGNFVFYGPVIIQGKLVTAGTGGHFNGAVMTANAEVGEWTNSMTGNAVVNYSACAVSKALQAMRKPKPIAQRGWSEAY